MTVWNKVSDFAASIGSSGSAFLHYLIGSTLKDETKGAPDLGTSFTIAIIALSAKMAKADGVVSTIEVDTFRQVIQISSSDARNVDRLFRIAQQDTAGFEVYAEQIRKLMRDDRRLLRDVLDALFHIASADRALHPAENLFLQTVADRFGLTNSEYLHVRAHFVHDETSPYDVLGVDPSVSNEQLKKQHRRLVRENHPDLAISRGVPPELIQAATRKLATINAAYAAVAKERSL
jgi:DnaJ like chaperone protein